MKTESCLYRGRIRHRRKRPSHAFTYTTSWAYLDLDEIDSLIDASWFLGRRRFSPIAFRRSDHLGDPDQPLRQCVADFVQRETGVRIDGRVTVLTQLSHFGIYFSPINLYYCFGQDGTLKAMVAEVSNTPWNERHHYVLWDGNRVENSRHRYAHPKAFHVSPFMGMDSTYQWRADAPDEACRVALGCDRNGERIFQAFLQLQRVPLTNFNVLRSVLRRPIAAVHVVGSIYFQALQLWIKRCQFFPHPGNPPQPPTPNAPLQMRPPVTAQQPAIKSVSEATPGTSPVNTKSTASAEA